LFYHTCIEIRIAECEFRIADFDHASLNSTRVTHHPSQVTITTHPRKECAGQHAKKDPTKL